MCTASTYKRSWGFFSSSVVLVIFVGSHPICHCSLEVLYHSILHLHAANTSLVLAFRTTSVNRKKLSGLGVLTLFFFLIFCKTIISSRKEEIWLSGNTRGCQTYQHRLISVFNNEVYFNHSLH